jgi:hypothetical protein
VQPEKNGAIVRRWFEEVVTGEPRVRGSAPLPGYVLHFPGLPAPVDREGHKQLVMMFRNAFPDWQETIDAVVAEGNKVVICVTGRGTHQRAASIPRLRANTR